MNIEKDFRDYWRLMLEKHGVDATNVPEIVKVHLHEYLFLTKQFNKVVAYLEERHDYKWRDVVAGLRGIDEELFWMYELSHHGTIFKELPQAYKNLLLEYSHLKHQALALYKHYTNGVIDRLSWCAEPIIEEIQKIEQGAA